MSTLSVTNTFLNGNNADASQVNTNFNDVVTYINANCITKDAALPFTAVPSGPATNPTTANQFARKAYVDRYKILMQKSTTFVDTPPFLNTNKLYQVDVVDPGYDINVWAVASVFVTAQTANNLANVWEIRLTTQLSTGASTVGAGTDWAGARYSIFTSNQSMITAAWAKTMTTGSSGFGTNGFFRIYARVYNIAGVQSNLPSAVDARYDYLQVFSEAAT